MEGGTLHRYKGNYSRYVEQKELQVLSQTRAYEAQQETIRRTEEYIRRYKAGIKARWLGDSVPAGPDGTH